MNIQKIFWHVRTILYKLFFKKMGNFSYIGKPIFLSGISHISIGNKVRIYPGARLETENGAEIDIGSNTSIGENIHIYSGGGIVLSIGESTTISSDVLITNTDHDYSQIGVHIMDQPTVTKQTRIGTNCFIGHAACILAGAQIGNQCIVGANAVVKAGVYPDYSVLAGIPARIIKKYDNDKKAWIKV
jgi:acetyltransferase-like isoleucine patch superfamily enzyme